MIYFPLLPLIPLYVKASCTQPSSKVQSGVSQCVWNRIDNRCSLRPPPNDLFFVVIVALVTTFLSIPILIILHCLINGYGSKWPGGKALLLDVDHEVTPASPPHTSDIANVPAAELLRNSLYSFTFGKESKKGLLASTADYTSNLESQNVFAEF